MYERFREDPASVGPTWQEFFSDFKPAGTPKADSTAEIVRPVAAPTPQPVATSPGVEPPAPRVVLATEIIPDPPAEPLRGVSAAIASNMEKSLTVPTATSFRNVPAKLLEVNRKVMNNYRARVGQGKVSFTHIIGYAIVRAIADNVPNMKNGYTVDADRTSTSVWPSTLTRAKASAHLLFQCCATPTRSTSRASCLRTTKSFARFVPTN
jgi:2-oxoglutarate dehydrogenase E1 component